MSNDEKKDNTKNDDSLDKIGMPKSFRLLFLVIWVIIFFTVYEVCITYNVKIIVHIYGILFGVFLLAYGIVNRGFFRSVLDPQNLPEGMDEEEKQEYIRKYKKRDNIAKMLLIPILAILLTFAFDFIYILFT